MEMNRQSLLIVGKPMRLADPTERPTSRERFRFYHSASEIAQPVEKSCGVIEYVEQVGAILKEARQSELACLQRRSYNYLSEDLLTKENVMSATLEALAAIEQHVQIIKDSPMGPGMPGVINEACVEGDCYSQGDLDLVVADSAAHKEFTLVHDGVKFSKLKGDAREEYLKKHDSLRKLVPGSQDGSKHILNSLDGVSVYHPKRFVLETEDYADLQGPVFICHEAKTVEHPTHGHIQIAAGHTIECVYQQEWDRLEQAARRARD